MLQNATQGREVVVGGGREDVPRRGEVDLIVEQVHRSDGATTGSVGRSAVEEALPVPRDVVGLGDDEQQVRRRRLVGARALQHPHVDRAARLSGEPDHGTQRAAADEVAPDAPAGPPVRRCGRHDHDDPPAGLDVAQAVLDPGQLRLPPRGQPVLPPEVGAQLVVPPGALPEGRLAHDRAEQAPREAVGAQGVADGQLDHAAVRDEAGSGDAAGRRIRVLPGEPGRSSGPGRGEQATHAAGRIEDRPAGHGGQIGDELRERIGGRRHPARRGVLEPPDQEAEGG